MIFHAILLLTFLPLALVGLIICTLTQMISPQKFSRISGFSASKKLRNEFTVLSANVCLMPEYLSRINNLPHTLTRAKGIAHRLAAPGVDELQNEIETQLPEPDVICLQEVFNEAAWTILNDDLKEKFENIIFDAHQVWISPLHFTAANSGLYIASKYAILRSEFYPYSDGYLEDALCCKGLLLAELDVGGDESIILGNTHLQAPTGDHIKSCIARAKQWNKITDYIDDFKRDSKHKIKLEIICGDFNTDRLTNFDDRCRASPCWNEFTDALEDIEGATCIWESACQDEHVATPEKLKQALEERNDKYIWCSEHEDDNGKVETVPNGIGRLDYILYRSDSDHVTTNSHIHTALAPLTDHIPISTKFKFK